jgi:hypothetical protein
MLISRPATASHILFVLVEQKVHQSIAEKAHFREGFPEGGTERSVPPQAARNKLLELSF